MGDTSTFEKVILFGFLRLEGIAIDTPIKPLSILLRRLLAVILDIECSHVSRQKTKWLPHVIFACGPLIKWIVPVCRISHFDHKAHTLFATPHSYKICNTPVEHHSLCQYIDAILRKKAIRNTSIANNYMRIYDVMTPTLHDGITRTLMRIYFNSVSMGSRSSSTSRNAFSGVNLPHYVVLIHIHIPWFITQSD